MAHTSCNIIIATEGNIVKITAMRSPALGEESKTTLAEKLSVSYL